MRILSLVLALVLIASGVLPAFAAKRTDVYNWGNMAEYSFAYGASLEAAYPNGACTGLSWEETDVKPKTAYVEQGGTFWYGKHWASARNSVSAPVSLKGERATKINVDFTRISSAFLTCIMPHVADEDQKASAPRGAQLFANYVYLPTEDNRNYPDYIRDKYADISQLKFYYYLFALLQSCPLAPPTASTVEDAVADTYKSMMAFSYSRCLEDGDLKGGVNSNPEADWNIVKNKLGGMYSKGVPAAWSQMCSAGAADFQKYWEMAAFLSCLSVAYDGAGGVDVLLPLTVASQGSDGRWHMTLDYSSYNEYAKKYLQKVTGAGSSKLKFVNNGSSIDISAASEADIKDAAELASVIMNSADLPQAPILCVELQPIGVVHGTYGTTNMVDICGQQRFAVTYMPLNIRISSKKKHYPSAGDVTRYEHLETFTATYNIAINKYDSETGQGLRDAGYEVTHTHDSALIDEENWDENTISDGCMISGALTDDNGVLSGLSDMTKGHRDVRTYSYHKGYCGGHTIPSFVDIPEEEEDEEGEIVNEGEIEAAKAENDGLIIRYFNDIVLCCRLEEEGGYFCKADGAGYSSSSTPTTGCDSKEEYESQCRNISSAPDELEDDRDEKYSEFISITYTYKVKEIKTKAGYSLHGVHNDDIPLEIKKVWSSEYMDGAVRTGEAFSGDKQTRSLLESAFGVMTVYAAEKENAETVVRILPAENIEEESGQQTAENITENNEPEDTAAEEVPAVCTPSEADEEITDGDVSDDLASDSDAEYTADPETIEATMSETEGINSVLAAIGDIWVSLLEFIRNAGAEIGDAFESAADDIGDFFDSSMHAFGLFGADRSTSGGTVATQGMASWQSSTLDRVDHADDSIVSHTWIIYGHRTEGEIHLTKRDINLAKNESADYDSYGDSNGDGTLEGAVYGLFAAQDIVHPDGHTGVVYYKDELTAVASTDRNGDLSFTAYTEAPGFVYSYTDGEAVKDPEHLSFTGPLNMHRSMGETETRYGTREYVGHKSSGTAVSIADYEPAGTDVYYKISSNQAKIEGIARNGSGNYRYPVYNNELNNGNCWIGRPIIVGESSSGYYIKELTRSEGYELSVNGKTNMFTNGSTSYVSTSAAAVTINDKRLTKGTAIGALALTVDVTAKSDDDLTGDIRIKAAGVHDNIQAALSDTTESVVKKIVAVPKTTEETVISKDNTPVILSGSRVEAEAGETKALISGTYTVTKVSEPEDVVMALSPTVLVHNRYPAGEKILEKIGSETGTDSERLVNGLNASFAVNAFTDPDEEAPWIKVELPSAMTMSDKVETVLTALSSGAASYATRLKFELHGGEVFVRYDHYDTIAGELTGSFCDITTGEVYLRMDSGKGYFVYIPFDSSDAVPGSWTSADIGGYTYTTGAVINSVRIDPSVMPAVYGTLDIAAAKAALIKEPAKRYWLYDGVMPELNDDGSVRKETKTRIITDADPEWGDAAYENVLWKYIDDPVETETVKLLTILNAEGDPVTAGDEDAYVMIPASAFAHRDTVTLKIFDNGKGFYTPDLSDTLTYMLPDAAADTYIVNAVLEYPGPSVTSQAKDALTGKDTVSEPLKIYERPIRQQIKVVKKIGTDADEARSVWYCANCGQENPDADGTCGFCGRARTSEPTRRINYGDDTYNAFHEENIVPKGSSVTDWLSRLLKGDLASDGNYETDIDNFRFKVYLRSNIERLYRNEEGEITWVDSNGNEIKPVYDETPGSAPNKEVRWKYVTAYGGRECCFPDVDIVSGTGAVRSVNVRKIYTKVEHNTDFDGTRVTGARANNVWNRYADPQAEGTWDAAEKSAYDTAERTDADPVSANDSLYSFVGRNVNTAETDKLNDAANKGFTRVLETTVTQVEDGTGTRMAGTYNYEKFFDAIHAANVDKWDSDKLISLNVYPGDPWTDVYSGVVQRTLADRNTSFRPFGFIREGVYGSRSSYLAMSAVFDGKYTEVMTARSAEAKLNAMASDMVRQFAVRWYLEDEAAKLVKANGLGEDIALSETVAYSEEIYDKALNAAIEKAYNYLEPFFKYDLDAIYAINWDSSEGGGSDRDYTTLSADAKQTAGEHYQTSAYLPYGVYVVVEEKPGRIDSEVNDLMNRSYRTEKPREVMVPTVYDDAKPDKYAENFSRNYEYKASAAVTDLAKSPRTGGYLIRWGEEWPHTGTAAAKTVIRAHSNDGDHEIYPYGLDVDHLTGSITDPGGAVYSYHGMRISQGADDPLKDYYAQEHLGHTMFKAADSAREAIGTAGGGNALGGPASFPLEDYPGNTAVTCSGGHYDLNAYRNRTYYGSVSEGYGRAPLVKMYTDVRTCSNPEGIWWKENVDSMTGVLTSYDGVYAQMLVPWTVTAPADDYEYSPDLFRGYADVVEENSFYSAILRVYKTDSETGELIIHDNAVFGLYAASRYTTQAEIDDDAALITDEAARAAFLDQFRPGDCKFRLEETEVTGSMEFLYGLGAYDVEPVLTAGGDFIYSEYNTDSPLCKGKVPAGTPVCLESEQIILEDTSGIRTGRMRVFTTMDDTLMGNASGGGRSYQLQNVGYFETPQPLGSGVYVLMELGRVPAGYVRIKPQAYEIYWDKTETYAGGNMFSKQTLTREK